MAQSSQKRRHRGSAYLHEHAIELTDKLQRKSDAPTGVAVMGDTANTQGVMKKRSRRVTPILDEQDGGDDDMDGLQRNLSNLQLLDEARTSTGAVARLLVAENTSGIQEAFAPDLWTAPDISFEALLGRLTRYGQQAGTNDPAGLTLILKLVRALVELAEEQGSTAAVEKTQNVLCSMGVVHMVFQQVRGWVATCVCPLRALIMMVVPCLCATDV